MANAGRKKQIVDIDYSEMEGGGLVRMLNRFRNEGTLTGDPDEDDFIRRSPEAALLGMLYDQRMLAEGAFTGPHRLFDRLGHLDMKKIAKLDPDKFKVLFAKTPAVHRFTNKMADYTQAVCKIVAEQYDNDPAKIWNDGADFATIQKRLVALTGFGKAKAMKMRFVLHYFGFRDFS
jgi:uncharacterized HhH-GPD family protein